MLQSGQHPAADTEKATVVYQLASNGNHTNGDIGKVRLVNTHTLELSNRFWSVK